jgi:hypothetical protein
MMGDKENALHFLEKGVVEHDINFDMNTDPDFYFLHADPRYAALLRRMGLPA